MAVGSGGERSISVVIVDDDVAVRERLAALLEARGYRVCGAPSGLRLLRLLEAERPDLILLDVSMSWIDGFELCRAIKQNASYCSIPIIFISGRSSQGDVETGLGCGAVDYFVKPLDTERLLARLAELT